MPSSESTVILFVTHPSLGQHLSHHYQSVSFSEQLTLRLQLVVHGIKNVSSIGLPTESQIANHFPNNAKYQADTIRSTLLVSRYTVVCRAAQEAGAQHP